MRTGVQGEYFFTKQILKLSISLQLEYRLWMSQNTGEKMKHAISIIGGIFLLDIRKFSLLYNNTRSPIPNSSYKHANANGVDIALTVISMLSMLCKCAANAWTMCIVRCLHNWHWS